MSSSPEPSVDSRRTPFRRSALSALPQALIAGALGILGLWPVALAAYLISHLTVGGGLILAIVVGWLIVFLGFWAVDAIFCAQSLSWLRGLISALVYVPLVALEPSIAATMRAPSPSPYVFTFCFAAGVVVLTRLPGMIVAWRRAAR